MPNTIRSFLVILTCLVLSLAQLSAQDSDDYPDDFYEPVDNTPETPEPEQPSNGGQAMLGGQFTPPSTHTQEANGTTPDQGIETRRIFPNTAAEDMGLKPGDIVLNVNGSDTNSISSLRDIVNNSSVGDDVTVIVSRDGEIIQLDSTFKEWLSGVPKGKIDRKAEERYREMQKRRLERRMSKTNDRQAAINQQLAAMKKSNNVDIDFDKLNQSQIEEQLAKELGVLPDFKLPAIDFSGLDFDFALHIDVDSNELTAANNDADKSLTVSEPLALLASIAPSIDLSYQFKVNGNEL